MSALRPGETVFVTDFRSLHWALEQVSRIQVPSAFAQRWRNSLHRTLQESRCGPGLHGAHRSMSSPDYMCGSIIERGICSFLFFSVLWV